MADEQEVSEAFASWLNGPTTRFCGEGYHDDCDGTINTIGIESPCRCGCHKEAKKVMEG